MIFISENVAHRLRAGRALALVVLWSASLVQAQSTSTNQVKSLDPVLVTAEAEADARIQPPFLPSVEGTRVYSGKKTTVMDLDALPPIVNNNYRQALSLTPGLLLSEETTPLVSLGYRGLAPHRAQYTQMLKDGIPIHADMFGYPEAYYTPPLDTVDRMEFLRGGASLLYGPQPGGALNYVTHMPRRDRRFSGGTAHIWGSDELYSTFTYATGTEGRLGYYTYYHHRQTEGFREANSDVGLDTGSVKLVLDADEDSRWIFAFDGYAEEHGEPGGLSLYAGPNYRVNRGATTRFNDRFRLERYFPSLTYERDFSENTRLEVRGWGGYYSRFSKRQTGGGFGTLATGAGNSIELQEFYTTAAEARLRHDWAGGDQPHSLAAGFMLYYMDSPRVDKTGATPAANDGVVVRDTQRDIFYAPLFVENRFSLGRFSVTPGLRLENVVQRVRERVNTAKTLAGTPLGRKSDHALVPLLGLGLEYAWKPFITSYANISQGYRPVLFTEAVPTGGGALINQDLEAAGSWQYEIGWRGNLQPWLVWDTSLFWMDFDNQIGTVGATVQNVGRSIHRGWEAALEFDPISLVDSLRGTDYAWRYGTVGWYANVMLLDAEFVSGPLTGRQPQYAPDYLLRTGLNYRWRDRVKVSLMGTFVADHFADDVNTTGAASREIPAYMTWDLTAEVYLYKKNASLLAGINNLFDEDYYARIRPDGIDPAYRRNFYMGFSLKF